MTTTTLTLNDSWLSRRNAFDWVFALLVLAGAFFAFSRYHGAMDYYEKAILVATVPVVASGFWGLLLCTVTYLGMFLGTRQVYSRYDIVAVAAGVLSGVALGVVTAILTHPDWIAGLVIGLAATAACIIVVVLLNPRTRLRLTRLADFAEWATIALLLPLAIIAGGWF